MKKKCNRSPPQMMSWSVLDGSKITAQPLLYKTDSPHGHIFLHCTWTPPEFFWNTCTCREQQDLSVLYWHKLHHIVVLSQDKHSIFGSIASLTFFCWRFSSKQCVERLCFSWEYQRTTSVCFFFFFIAQCSPHYILTAVQNFTKCFPRNFPKNLSARIKCQRDLSHLGFPLNDLSGSWNSCRMPIIQCFWMLQVQFTSADVETKERQRGSSNTSDSDRFLSSALLKIPIILERWFLVLLSSCSQYVCVCVYLILTVFLELFVCVCTAQ